jgi:hypothetical protein
MMTKVPLDDILYVKADGDYIVIHKAEREDIDDAHDSEVPRRNNCLSTASAVRTVPGSSTLTKPAASAMAKSSSPTPSSPSPIPAKPLSSNSSHISPSS